MVEQTECNCEGIEYCECGEWCECSDTGECACGFCIEIEDEQEDVS